MTNKEIAKRFNEVGLLFETQKPKFGICYELKDVSCKAVFSEYVYNIHYILPIRDIDECHRKKHDYIRAILCYLISEAIKSE